MINFSASTIDDVPQLTEWIAHDPYHFRQCNPEWWITGNDNLLAFCLMDERGPLTFTRLDSEGEYVRIHCQFPPRREVSQRRLVVGMIQCMDKLIELYRTDTSCKGMIFNSINPTLITFMSKRFGFVFDKNNDYVLKF